MPCEVKGAACKSLSGLATATLRAHISGVDISADRSRGLAIPAFADFFPQNLDTNRSGLSAGSSKSKL
jgi:hypothetical protein